MDVPTAALDQYRQQQLLTARTVLTGRRLWAGMGGDLVATWRTLVGPQLLALITSAQKEAADAVPGYVDDVVGELGASSKAAAGQLDTASLIGIAADGRTLAGLLYGAVTTALQRVGQGATVPQALAGGQSFLDTVTRTTLADTHRVGTGIEVTARPGMAYVRLVVPPCCSRCAILGGRKYRYSRGFQRHPRCDCRMIPAPEAIAGDLTTDPAAYFASLTPAEQDRVFTVDGAKAIRDGADINQVVNVRRSAAGLNPAGRLTDSERAALKARKSLQRTDVYGKPLYVTREGVTRRGRFGTSTAGAQGVPRLMPESIYEIASSRDDAVRLLRRFGYLT